MDNFQLIENIEFRRTVRYFYEKLNQKLKGSNNSILYFILLEEEFLQEEFPYDYPSYIIVTRGEVNRDIINNVCFQVQDELGWPYGHYLVNSYSRRNILSLGKLREGLLAKDCYLDEGDCDKILKKQYITLFEDERLYFKELIFDAIRDLKYNIENTIKSLNISSLEETQRKFQSLSDIEDGLKYIASIDYCRKRGLGRIPDTELLRAMKNMLVEYSAFGQEQKLMLYGRLNGSGKSQYMYYLMSYLYSIKEPFIFRENFYFHYNLFQQEKHKKRDRFKYYLMEGAEDSMADSWLLKVAKSIEDAKGKKPILFLDEADLDYHRLSEYFIVRGDKDKVSAGEDWRVFDMQALEPLHEGYVKEALLEELKILKVSIAEEVLISIAKHSRHPLYDNHIYSIYHGKALLTLAALEAAARCIKYGAFYITVEDVEKWAAYLWIKPVPKPRVVMDFHCEYIVFDGEKLEYDPYTSFDVEELLKINKENREQFFSYHEEKH